MTATAWEGSYKEGYQMMKLLPGRSITPGHHMPHQCRVLERPAGTDPARPRARQAEAPRLVTIYSATRQALAMMVRVGLAPVAVGKGEPSTT